MQERKIRQHIADLYFCIKTIFICLSKEEKFSSGKFPKEKKKPVTLENHET